MTVTESDEIANSTYYILHVEKVMQFFLYCYFSAFFVLAELSQKLNQTRDVGKGDTAETVMSAQRVRDQRHSMTY